jgi:hypothetical protein
MDSEEISACYDKTKEADTTRKIKIINDDCEGPDQWVKTQIIDDVRSPILNYISSLRKKADELAELIDHTRKKKVLNDNKIILRKMIEERVRMAETFLDFLEKQRNEYKSQKKEL